MRRPERAGGGARTTIWTSCWIGKRHRPRSPPAGSTSVRTLRIARVGLDADRLVRLAAGQDHARAAADQLHDRRHVTCRAHQPASERGSASLVDRHVRRFAAREPAMPQADARAAPPAPDIPLLANIGAAQLRSGRARATGVNGTPATRASAPNCRAVPKRPSRDEPRSARNGRGDRGSI